MVSRRARRAFPSPPFPTMATPFDKFRYVDAQQTVARATAANDLTGFTVQPLLGTGRADSSPRPLNLTNNVAGLRRMLDGDHWLDANGWIGPRPSPMDNGYSETMGLVQQAFVSENALADVIERHVAGVLGREPHWGFTVRRALKDDEEPTTAEQALIDEAEAIVTEWWDARKLHAYMQGLARTLLYARRAPARLYVPRGKLKLQNRGGKTVRIIDADGVQGGIGYVWPEEPLPERAAVAVDHDTKESVGVALTLVGTSVAGTDPGQPRAEIVYVNEQGQTIIRQVGEGTPLGGEAAAAVLDFGGRLTMYEMSRPRFITVQMVQIQRAMNLALSMLPRSVVTSGFLERVITNAQMPGTWTTDAETGTRKFVPAPYKPGAGSTTFLAGLENIDEATGQKSFATPGVHFRDPSPVTPVVEAFESLYRAMLREARQEHVLMGQDIKASGKAREQARADFEMTLRKTTSELNPLGRWIIETALSMAEAFAGTPGKYTKDLRATFTCTVDTGPITADERKSNDGSYGAGTLSREGAMSANGVADVDAELAKLAGDPGALIASRVQMANAIAALVTAGASLEGAAEFVGLTPDEAAELVPSFDDTTPEGPFAPPAPVDLSADPGAPATPPAPGGGGRNGTAPGRNGKRPGRNDSARGGAAGAARRNDTAPADGGVHSNGSAGAGG